MGYLGNAPADQAIQIGSDTILSSHIDDGVIVDADINASASISVSKTALAGGTGLTLSTNTLNVDAAQTQITSVGTIGTGVWNGTAIASAYLDADTAHLSGTQTFSGAKTFTSSPLLLSASSSRFSISRTSTSGNADLSFRTNNSETDGCWTVRMGSDTTPDLSFNRWTDGSTDTAIMTLNHDGNTTFAGQIKASDGTAGAPSYSFSTDPDTGIYWGGTNAMGFVTGGTSRMELRANGSLVINQDLTTAYALEIDHEGDAYNGLHVDASALTTGSAAHFYSSINRTANYPLVELQDDNGGAGGYGLKIRVDGNGDYLRCYNETNVHAKIDINGNFTTAGGMFITQADHSNTDAYFGLGNDADYGQIGANEIGLWNVNDNDIIFGTNNALRMTIQNDGKVGIGCTPSAPLHVLLNAGVNSTVELLRLDMNEGSHVGGKGGAIVWKDISVYDDCLSIEGVRDGVSGNSRMYVRLREESTAQFEVHSNNTVSVAGSSVHTSSDETLKKDISTIPSALDKVNQMRGVQFKWKKEHDVYTDENHQYHQRVNIGFIAQELEAVVPEIVNTHQDTGIKSVQDANQINALLVEAVKELSAKVTALENA